MSAELVKRLEELALENQKLKETIEGYQRVLVTKDAMEEVEKPLEIWENRELRNRVKTIDVPVDANAVARVYHPDRSEVRKVLGEAIRGMVLETDFRRCLQAYQTPHGRLVLRLQALAPYRREHRDRALGLENPFEDFLREW